MTNLLSIDFWSDQTATVVFITLVLAVLAVFKIKLAQTKNEMRKLIAQTEAVESRLQLAREINAGEGEAIANIRAEVARLHQLIARPNAFEPEIKEIDASAAILAMNNTTIDHVLTAKELAIGGLEEKQKLKLVLHPS